MKLTNKRIKEILSQYAPGANLVVSVSHDDIKELCVLALEGKINRQLRKAYDRGLLKFVDKRVTKQVKR